MHVLDIPKNPVSGWTKCRNADECNYLGFRSSKINYTPDDFVVLLVGDSLVEGTIAIPFEKMPESRLKHFLNQYRKNVKVFTIGTVGYGQDQQLLAVREYFKEHRADLVVLFHSIITDVENNMFPVSGKNYTVKPTFWLEKGELRGPTEGWLEPVGPFLKWALLWQSYVGNTTGESRMDKWKKEMLPAPYRPPDYYDGEVDHSWHEMWEKNPEEAFAGIDYERIGQGNQLTPRSEMRQYGIDLTRKLFYEIKRVVEDNSGHFLIFKDERPVEIQDPEWEKGYYLNGRYYVLSRRQYLDNLEALYSGFEHHRILLDMDNITMSEEDQHLSGQAIDELMKKLAVIISKKDYFKE